MRMWNVERKSGERLINVSNSKNDNFPSKNKFCQLFFIKYLIKFPPLSMSPSSIIFSVIFCCSSLASSSLVKCLSTWRMSDSPMNFKMRQMSHGVNLLLIKSLPHLHHNHKCERRKGSLNLAVHALRKLTSSRETLQSLNFRSRLSRSNYRWHQRSCVKRI